MVCAKVLILGGGNFATIPILSAIRFSSLKEDGKKTNSVPSIIYVFNCAVETNESIVISIVSSFVESKSEHGFKSFSRGIQVWPREERLWRIT